MVVVEEMRSPRVSSAAFSGTKSHCVWLVGWWVGQWTFRVWFFCITAGYSSLREARDHGGQTLRFYGFCCLREKRTITLYE